MYMLCNNRRVVSTHKTKLQAIFQAISLNYSVKLNQIVVGKSAKDGRIFLCYPWSIKVSV